MTGVGDDGAVSEQEHYFSADPSVPFTRAPVRARVWGNDLVMESGSGVFAKGRLDIGTSVLLRETTPPGPGRYLDLGCGYGVIGLAIAVAQPGATVDAVDVNERALLLAADNAEARASALVPSGGSASTSATRKPFGAAPPKASASDMPTKPPPAMITS